MEAINYAEDDLKKMTVKDLRILAGRLNLKRYQSLRKANLIQAILIKQKESQDAVKKFNQLNSLESDLTKLDSSFSNCIQRYLYHPIELSEVGEIVRYLYPKLLYIASRYDNYKISMDIQAIFAPSKINIDYAEYMNLTKNNVL